MAIRVPQANQGTRDDAQVLLSLRCKRPALDQAKADDGPDSAPTIMFVGHIDHNNVCGEIDGGRDARKTKFAPALAKLFGGLDKHGRLCVIDRLARVVCGDVVETIAIGDANASLNRLPTFERRMDARDQGATPNRNRQTLAV
jgi:hypothetical protein